MANNFTFWHNYSGSWFFSSYWSPWTAYARNDSSESRLLSGIVFTFVSGNSGGQSFHVGGSSYLTANGSGCNMKCIARYGNNSTESELVIIPPTKYTNITGNLGNNMQCWFTPRPGPAHTFYFKNPISVPPKGVVTLQFYVVQWTGGGGSSGYPVLQVSSKDGLSEPTSFQVTFDLDGGYRTGGGALSQTVLNGKDAVPPTCEKIGYRFISWDKPYTSITANTTITALWEALPIWKYDGTKWVKCLVSKEFNGTDWKDIDTRKLEDTWKIL